MKNRKKLLTLLIALTLITPSLLLQACKQPTVESEITSDSTTSSLETSIPTEDSTENAPSESQPLPPAEPVTPVVKKTQYIRCTGNNVNLRAGAGTDYAVLGVANANEAYAVVGKIGNWYKTYYRGKTAYLYAEYAAVFSLEKSENQEVESVLNEGYKLIGVPYVYGAVRLHDGKGNLLSGFTAQKFDCSSLVQYVFYKGADTLLQVTTRTQVKQGEFVPKSELQRGDCIYFTNESRQHLTGNERVGHVAVYLGNDYILHTAFDYARIEKMSKTRWNFYIEARRFI